MPRRINRPAAAYASFLTDLRRVIASAGKSLCGPIDRRRRFARGAVRDIALVTVTCQTRVVTSLRRVQRAQAARLEWHTGRT